MRKLKGWQRYFERELTLSNLKRKNRGDVLVGKLRAGDEMELNNGRKVDIEKMKDPDVGGDWKDVDVAVSNITDDQGRYDVEKATDYLKKSNRLTKVFLDEDDGEVYTLSDFKKTTDFGSSGSGRRIREHESIQALFLAKRLAEGQDIPSDAEEIANIMYRISEVVKMTREIRVEGAESDYEVRVAPTFFLDDEVIDYYMADPAWVATFTKVPNMLARFRQPGSDTPLIPAERSYVIFHISCKDSDSVPARLISTYNRINRTAEHSVEFSKYNPADVYMVQSDKVDEVNSEIDSCTDVMALNTLANTLFDDRILIPISLKRTGPEEGETLIVVNAAEGMDLPEFEVRRLRVSNEISKGIGTKIITMSSWMNDGETIETPRNLSIDSPNTGQNVNVDGEIDGKWARHGKISLSWMKKFIEESKLYDKVRDYVEGEPIVAFPDLSRLSEEELEEELEALNADVLSMERDMNVEVIPDTRGRSVEGEDRKRKLISKVQSMQVIRALAVIDSLDDSEDEREIDAVVSRMLLYALSIKNPSFTSPRYIRVVER